MDELTPRRWWTGPFDVERLAGEAVEGLREAADELATSRGFEVALGTTPELIAASFAAYENLRRDGRAPAVWAELSGFVAARDGWVRLHGNYPHHAAVIREVLGVDGRRGLERAASRWDASDLEEAITAAGGVAVAVRTRTQWEAHPQARAASDAPWSEVSDRGDRPGPGGPADRRPGRGAGHGGFEAADGHERGGRNLLEGVRVLDLTRVIAGPTCSQVLACLGADVLRIDPPQRPEILEQHLSTSMGKRSAEVDLRRDADRVRTLAADADVILTGYRPGALERFGLGTEALEAIAPQAVIVSLSAWGEGGPWGRRIGFDSIVQAATGIAVDCGTADRPGALPVQALDHASGHLMAARVLEALARSRACTIRISLLGAAHQLLSGPPPPEVEPAALGIPRVRLDSAVGTLDLVPPPLLIDGRTIERPVGDYGAADASWRG